MTEYTLQIGRKFYDVILTPDTQDGGYTVRCKQIPAAISQGETKGEALENIQDAIELCLEFDKEKSNLPRFYS